MNYLLIILVFVVQYSFVYSDEVEDKKLKINISFTGNKIKIDEKKINFIISVENISNSSFTLLEDFSFDRTVEIIFESIKTSDRFYLGEIVKYDYGSEFIERYITLKPKEKVELKVAKLEESIKDFSLPKGKYKVWVTYVSSKGKDSLKGVFTSSEITVEKE